MASVDIDRVRVLEDRLPATPVVVVESSSTDPSRKRASLLRLRAALQKIPSDVLWDVLDKSIIPVLQDHSTKIMDDINEVIEEEFDKYLSNPSPPDLNTRVMRREFSTLFEDLHRLSEDGVSSRETDWQEWAATLEQVADSFKYWLERIWLCVWEYGCSFEKAHECLMIAQNYFDLLLVPKMGCVCPFTTLPICIVFKNLAGDIVKQWDTLSGVVVQDVIFWTWRELFMSMLWNSRPGNEDMIQRMIREIEQTYGGCHHIILCGGEPNGYGIDGSYNDYIDSEGEDFEEEGSEMGLMMFYADHWEGASDVYDDLVDILVQAMKTYFESHPTLHAYRTLCSIEHCHQELQEKLLEISVYSRAAALCALAVFQHIHLPSSMRTVLENASHLFEAQDGVSLRIATSFLIKHPESKDFALSFVEKQLSACLETARSSFFWTFKFGEAEDVLQELSTLSSLAPRSAKRSEKVQAWVKNILIAKSPLTDPFSMAAMIFGLDDHQDDDDGDEDDEDQTNLDRDPNLQFDGAVEHLSISAARPKPRDLCEIGRKYQVKRISEWLQLLTSLSHDLRPARNKILLNFERLVYQRLPWMKFPDVVAELKLQYSKRRDERHLRGLLVFFESFLNDRKAHHKRVQDAKARKAKKAAEEAAKKSRVDLINEID